MALKIAAASAEETVFQGLANLEQQAAYLVGLLLERQNAYNAANPTSVKNIVAVSPNYATSQATYQMVVPIEGDSVLQPLHENVTAAIPGA